MDSAKVYLAFHNEYYYGVADDQAYGDDLVEEVVCNDSDNSNMAAVGNISRREYDDILFHPFHIHLMDTG